ncbi:MAG: DUF4347 domain-containing protein, partial [Acidocella sp.]|nr:DUF4347 domain-containing protein [Acidocella sp.]
MKNHKEKSLKRALRTRAKAPPFLPNDNFLLLERRIAFDAAGAATLAIAQNDAHRANPSPLDYASTREPSHIGSVLSKVPVVSATDAAHAANGHFSEIVFIDGSLQGLNTLVADISAQLKPGAEIIILNPLKDGVSQITDVLAAQSGVQTVQIVSHGSAGNLYLGTADLNTTSMGTTYAEDLASIKASLGANSQILVYGCDFAQGADGASAALRLGNATGASIEASTDLTGAASLGANWTLEYHSGNAPVTASFDARLMANWHSDLAPAAVAPGGPVTVATTSFSKGTISGGSSLITSTVSLTANLTGYVAATADATVHFAWLDNSANITVNGNSVSSAAGFELQPGNTPGYTLANVLIGGTALNTPWVANSKGLDRLTVVTSASGTKVTASATTSSTAMQAASGGGGASTFVAGVNTINVVLLDGGGADGMVGSALVTAYKAGTISNVIRPDSTAVSVAAGTYFVDTTGVAMTYSATGLPLGLSINSTTGAITGTIDHNASLNAPSVSGTNGLIDGKYTVVVTASNANGTATQTFTIDATNQAPVLGTATTNQASLDGAIVTPVDASKAFVDPNTGDVV